MLTRLDLGSLSVCGVSVGGVYTSLLVPELSAIFDAGLAPRSFVGAKFLFLSHGHADHIGALPSLIGIRGLSHQPAPTTFMPSEIVEDISAGLFSFSRGQRRAIDVPIVGMQPGDSAQLGADLHVRALRTLHSVPSLAYVLYRRVDKLKPEFLGMNHEQIAQLRRQGAALFEQVERHELAYVTDTLVDVLDQNPLLFSVRTLVLECTFLDEKKSRADSRVKFHIHLDEIIERAEQFENERIVLMHFSQSYQPAEVHRILAARLPARLRERVVALCPTHGPWPG
jgi:ribonuclease Z